MAPSRSRSKGAPASREQKTVSAGAPTVAINITNRRQGAPLPRKASVEEPLTFIKLTVAKPIVSVIMSILFAMLPGHDTSR